MLENNINNFVFLPVLTLFLFMQFTFIPQLFFGGIFPDLFLFALIAGSLLYKDSSILYISLFFGLIFDVMSGLQFGLTAISMLFSVFVSSQLGYYFLKELFSVNLFLISFAAVIAHNLLYFALLNVFTNYRFFGETYLLAVVILFNMLYIALLIYPLIFIFSQNKNEKQIHYKEEK